MKKRVATLALMITAQAFAWQPIFQEHETINIGGTEFKDLPINLYGDGKFRGYPAINFTDFNGDGLNDLVVALFDKGAIAVAENVGTQTEPQFDEYRFLTNESRDTSFANPIWCMGASIPQVEDMNNDGHLDIVVSNYLCDIMYYEGNGTDSFAEFKRFKLEDGSELTYTEENQQNQINARNPSRTYGAVKLHDWDEDGFIDILFTSNHIGVTVFINTGNDGVPVFKLGEEIKVNDQEIRYDRPSIDVFDINCDGAKDLVMGMNKKGTYILNSGTNKAPEFSEIHDLYVEDSIKIEMDGVTANPIHGEIQVNVADWNSDGYPDLIVGENCGWTISPPFEKAYLFLGKPDGTVDVTSPAATPKSTAISIGVVGKKVSYKLPESGTTTLTLYSLRGRKIAEHSLDHAIDGVIELSDIANGSYIVQMQSNNIVHRQIINLF